MKMLSDSHSRIQKTTQNQKHFGWLPQTEYAHNTRWHTR